jgi:secretion/DNA translocation related TadE-like protein
VIGPVIGTRSSRDERGLAAPVVVTLTGMLLVLSLLGAGLCRLLVDQRRAASAADLAALSGASALQHGQDACAAAGETALRNQAALVGCSVAGDRVLVRTAVRSPGTGGLLGLLDDAVPVEAEAHAGPVG